MQKLLFIFCLVSIGLSIGMSSYPKTTLPLSRLTYFNQSGHSNRQSILVKDNIASIENHFNNKSTSQISNKNPLPKQLGIYGLEFLGGCVGVGPSFYLAFMSMGPDFDYDAIHRMTLSYTIGNTLISSTTTWLTGKLLKQKSTWVKSALGAGIGSLVGVGSGILLDHFFPEGFMNGVALSVILAMPPLGAVIGNNL